MYPCCKRLPVRYRFQLLKSETFVQTWANRTSWKDTMKKPFNQWCLFKGIYFAKGFMYCVTCELTGKCYILCHWFVFKCTCTNYLHLEIDIKGGWRTKLYDKRDDFDFPIVNFQFMPSNIPVAPAFVYFSINTLLQRLCFLSGFYW